MKNIFNFSPKNEQDVLRRVQYHTSTKNQIPLSTWSSILWEFIPESLIDYETYYFHEELFDSWEVELYNKFKTPQQAKNIILSRVQDRKLNEVFILNVEPESGLTEENTKSTYSPERDQPWLKTV